MLDEDLDSGGRDLSRLSEAVSVTQETSRQGLTATEVTRCKVMSLVAKSGPRVFLVPAPPTD